MIPGVLAANPLERLLSQPQLLVLFAAGVVWVLKLVAKASTSAARKAGPVAETNRREAEDSEAAARRAMEDDERARRVREEILRKIAARRSQAGRVPPQTPPQIRPAPACVLEPPRATVIPVSVESAEEKVPALPMASLPAFPRAAAPAAAPTLQASAPVSPWLEELRTRDSARRAILLREILGPPVALR